MSRLQQARENSSHDRPMLLFVDLDLPFQIELKWRPAIGVRRRDPGHDRSQHGGNQKLPPEGEGRCQIEIWAAGHSARLHIGRQLCRGSWAASGAHPRRDCDAEEEGDGEGLEDEVRAVDAGGDGGAVFEGGAGVGVRAPGEEGEEAESDRITGGEELVEEGQVGQRRQLVVIGLLEKDQGEERGGRDRDADIAQRARHGGREQHHRHDDQQREDPGEKRAPIVGLVDHL